MLLENLLCQTIQPWAERIKRILLWMCTYCCRSPMVIISIIQIICYFIDKSIHKDSTLTDIFQFDPDKPGQVWRYLTYMFVHIGYQHLIMNVAAQILIGIFLETDHGWWRIMLIYLAGVLVGSLASLIVNPRNLLLGCSGGVYSLITAYIVSSIMNWDKDIWCREGGLLVIFAIVATNIIMEIHDKCSLSKDNYISYTAHLAGALAGSLVGIVVLKNLPVTKRKPYIRIV